MPKPIIKVVPGQIWADKYPGNKGRTVRIVEMDSVRATVEVEAEAEAVWVTGSTIGRRSRVLYDDRGLRGYRLVSEPASEPDPRIANGSAYARVLDFVENLPSEGDAIAGYTRGGKQYKLTGTDLRDLLNGYAHNIAHNPEETP